VNHPRYTCLTCHPCRIVVPVPVEAPFAPVVAASMMLEAKGCPHVRDPRGAGALFALDNLRAQNWVGASLG
jgi:hypothetical protein